MKWSEKSPVFFLPILFITCTIFVGVQSAVHLECIETREEYQSQHWATDGGSYGFAQTTADLPGDLKNLPDASEIIYMDGTNQASLFRRWLADLELTPPFFLYAKYYAVRKSNPTTTYVYMNPAKSPDDPNDKNCIKVLPLPTDSKWAEAFIEIRTDALDYAALAMSNAQPGDIIVADRFILSLGRQVNSMKDMKALCGWDDGTDPGPSPNPGLCKEEGKYPDPSDCTKYHVCERTEAGDLTDTTFTCADKMNWCPETKECGQPESCPCENHSFSIKADFSLILCTFILFTLTMKFFSV